MHGFTIDFLTGNTTVPPAYDGQEYEPQTKQNHELPVTTSAYYPPVHLDDVYSVISNDAAVSATAGLTSALELPTSGHCVDDVERGTPSPNRDSGIESDHSPGHSTRSTESVEKTLIKLEHTAQAVKTKDPATSADKPGHSYLALIAKAILSSPERKLTLGDIYRHIMDNNPYYDNGEKAWRGSIRYTLSINECFIKDGKDESGKGNFWAIHQACVDDFEKGDYRRRQARRRAKRNIKSVNNYPRQALMTHRNAMYTPMTSAYVYNPYVTGQTAYPYGHQNYAYGYAKPEPEAAHTQQSSALPNHAQLHPAFGRDHSRPHQSTVSENHMQPHPALGYPGYSAAYGYMYQDYSAAESAYKRELEKYQQQYDTAEAKKWSLTSDQSESSTARDPSPSGNSPRGNEIHIV